MWLFTTSPAFPNKSYAVACALLSLHANHCLAQQFSNSGIALYLLFAVIGPEIAS
jgi:hypothetical protein